MVAASIFLAVSILIYNYMIFELMDKFLEGPKLTKLYRILVGIMNTVVGIALIELAGRTSFAAYLIIGVILFIEFVIFYKDKYSRSLFCMLACLIHIMAIRSFCIAFIATIMDNTLYGVLVDPFWFVMSTAITFSLLNVAILLVLMFVPAKGVRIINQHDEQLWFMIAWLSVFCTYMLINSRVYSTPRTHPYLLDNQILAPLAILMGTYIVLFFSIRMGRLLGYKEKNEQLQHVVEKERQYRMSIDKDVFRIIEVNFNKNQLISGFEEYEPQLGDIVHNYTEMLAFMIRTTVHSEDSAEFIKYSSPTTVIEEYEQGKREIAFDYRRLLPEGVYVWMRVFMPLMRDEETGDIRGFVQIKNIDDVKKQQLELQYKAERDLLTGLYNKGTTEKLIAEYLFSTKVNGIASGVLFVIDIDNFKTINDRLGHLYGDAVLSELSESLKEVFREDDIVGRIGGDEFLVFAKGNISQNTIIKKAEELCKAFLRTYANEQNEGFTVSCSVGISIFPKDGATFDVLFKCADAALYATKARGKNSYSFFDDELVELPYVSTRTEIDNHGAVQKNFKENRIEYAFRLLYGSDDTKSAIESVLELIAKNFGFSRANIFEFNELSTHFNGVFEWCANGVESVSANYIDMPLSSFDFVVSELDQKGGMMVSIPSDFPEYAQESYTAINIKYIVHFSIKERDKMIGVIAFQHCIDDHFMLAPSELEELRIICQVLSVFMAKQLSNVREQRHHHAIEAVIDNMNSIAYVIDRETYDVFYENQNVVAITGHSSIGTKCYRSYRGLDAPCPDCALNHVSDKDPRCTLELYTPKFDLYTKTSAALVDWSNDRKALLISSVDISEYKRQDKKKEQGGD